MNEGARKHSRKRDAILKALQSTTAHPGARWVYEQLKPAIPGLSLGTVYRNLSLFREEGLTASLGVVNGEERFDGNAAPHPHAVCTCCGKVQDIPVKTGAELAARVPVEIIEKKEKIEKSGFSIDLRNTMFYGLCSGCECACGRETGAHVSKGTTA